LLLFGDDDCFYVECASTNACNSAPDDDAIHVPSTGRRIIAGKAGSWLSIDRRGQRFTINIHQTLGTAPPPALAIGTKTHV